MRKRDGVSGAIRGVILPVETTIISHMAELYPRTINRSTTSYRQEQAFIGQHKTCYVLIFPKFSACRELRTLASQLHIAEECAINLVALIRVTITRNNGVGLA